jgi:hypothetical protein
VNQCEIFCKYFENYSGAIFAICGNLSDVTPTDGINKQSWCKEAYSSLNIHGSDEKIGKKNHQVKFDH